MEYEIICPSCECEFSHDPEFDDGMDIMCPMCGANTDEYDSEYDGQPDEMQEWQDFDPDC